MQFALVLLASAASFRTVFALPAVEAVEAAEHVEMTEAANLDPLMGSKETDRTLSPVDEMNWRKRPFPVSNSHACSAPLFWSIRRLWPSVLFYASGP